MSAPEKPPALKSEKRTNRLLRAVVIGFALLLVGTAATAFFRMQLV